LTYLSVIFGRPLLTYPHHAPAVHGGASVIERSIRICQHADCGGCLLPRNARRRVKIAHALCKLTAVPCTWRNPN